MALLVFSFSLKAQQYVSTEPANRNVIIEEFTGRNCQYCPDGHRIVNELMAANPGRLWGVNIHAGGYAPTSYPNMITTPGNTIHSGFSISGYPSGVVNRTTAAAQSRSAWSGLANQQLNQTAECNIAGVVQVNADTRIATITVEVYYTSNSAYQENYLTVAMLQDSILGSQVGGSTWNPSQMINGQYVHTHALRDILTDNAWGDPISPTTQGTLITRTIEYAIPEVIGSPNGVEVDLNNISFLAWVSERYQGTPTRPILNACELERSNMTNEPIYPMISDVKQVVEASCSTVKSFGFNLSNIGLNELTSVRFNAEVGGVNTDFEWTGSLPSGETTKIDFTMDLPFGSYTGTLNIIEANGVPFESSKNFSAEVLEWAVTFTSDATTLVKVYIIQDQFGEQITWDIINSNGETVATGGPYQHLLGSGATQPNVQNVNNLPANDCYLFRIYDSQGNGICCNYGNGYYYVKDAGGNVLFGGEGNGDFGAEADHLFSISYSTNIQVTTEDPRLISDTEVMFIGTVEGEPDEVGFEYYKLVDHVLMTVDGELNGTVFTATVDDLEGDAMYSVRAYAVTNGVTIYGDEIHFHTLATGIGELENSLKVYPNPAYEVLNVEGMMTSLEVYNTLGQCLLAKPVNGNTQIDLSAFTNGIYFLCVYNNGETAIRKFLVNR